MGRLLYLWLSQQWWVFLTDNLTASNHQAIILQEVTKMISPNTKLKSISSISSNPSANIECTNLDNDYLLMVLKSGHFTTTCYPADIHVYAYQMGQTEYWPNWHIYQNFHNNVPAHINFSVLNLLPNPPIVPYCCCFSLEQTCWTFS